MAGTEPRLRKKEDTAKDTSQDAAADSQEEGSVMKGLLSCIAVMGGVSIAIWLAFFVFLEPYDPNKTVTCTQVESWVDLTGSLTVIDTIEFDWKSFGEAMGLDEDQLANVTQDGPDFTISEAVELILRMWYKSTNKACWEKLVSSLNSINERENAKKLARKFLKQ